MKPTKPVLLLLGRPDCDLCEEFRAQLEQAFPGRFELREACVDDDPDWQRRYGLKVPVLLDGSGALLCATRFDPACINS
jgi:thioredoxin-like negative regulator of GroEL